MTGIDVSGLGEFIRSQRHAAQVSLRELARQTGISNPYLSQIERGVRKPSAEILAQLAKGLQISAETLYERAGLLDERQGDRSVLDAIRADSTLAERQRQVLLEIYTAFQSENAATRARTERTDDTDDTTRKDPS